MPIKYDSRLRENVRNFKIVTFEHTKRTHQDQLSHLKALVSEYNSNLLPGELPITFKEMSSQLERKCDMIADIILEKGRDTLAKELGKKGDKMTNETEKLLEKLLEDANENLDKAYKKVRIAISDSRTEPIADILKEILTNIDKAKEELEKLLYPAVSNVEIFAIVDGDGRIVSKYSEANHI